MGQCILQTSIRSKWGAWLGSREAFCLPPATSCLLLRSTSCPTSCLPQAFLLPTAYLLSTSCLPRPISGLPLAQPPAYLRSTSCPQGINWAQLSVPVSPLQDSKAATPGVKPSHLLCITVEEVGGPTTTTPPSLHLHLHLPLPSSVIVIPVTHYTQHCTTTALQQSYLVVLLHYSQAWSNPKRSQTCHHFVQHFIRIDHGWLSYLFSLFLPLTMRNTHSVHIQSFSSASLTPPYPCSTSIRNIEQNDTNLGHLTQVRFDLGFNSPVQNRTISQQI